MTVASRSSPTGSLCGMGRSSRLTRPLCPRSPPLGRPVLGATRPELLASARCRLVVIGVEVGGRWGSEAASFLRLLARARARAAPEALRPALRSAYVHRWSSLLCAAASLAFADSLTSLPSPGLSNLDGPCPDLSDLLAACPFSPPGASRLPAR